MAWARSRRRKSGTYYYVISEGKTFAAGKGRVGRELAQEWAAAMTKARRAEKAGMRADETPGPCLWTLTDLYRADMTEARRRGLRTVLPQFQGKTSKRESDWRQLLAFFGVETNLDAVSGERIRAFIEARETAGVGPAAINRGLFGILRPALRTARERKEETGYAREPFLGIRKLDERAGARKPIALPEREVWRVIRRCWRTSRKLGAYVELLFLTASRLNEHPEVSGGFLRYPAYKRGKPRAFHLTPRVAVLAALPRAFDRKLWTASATAAGHPTLRPHDLRHTALTLAGKVPTASLDSIQKLGGWRSAAMADRYLHPDAAAIEPLGGPPVARKARRSRETIA